MPCVTPRNDNTEIKLFHRIDTLYAFNTKFHNAIDTSFLFFFFKKKTLSVTYILIKTTIHALAKCQDITSVKKHK